MWSKKGTHTARRPRGSWPDLCARSKHSQLAMQVRNVSVGLFSIVAQSACVVIAWDVSLKRLLCCWRCGAVVWGLDGAAVAEQQNLL